MRRLLAVFSPRAWLDPAGGCGRAVPVRAEGGGRRRRGGGGHGGRPDLRRPPARVGGSRRLRDPPGPPGVTGQRHRDPPGHRRVHQRAGRRPRRGPPGLGADRRGARAPPDPGHHSARGQPPRGGDARGPGQAGLGQVHPRRGRRRVHRSRGPRRGFLTGLDVCDAAFRPARRDALRLGRQHVPGAGDQPFLGQPRRTRVSLEAGRQPLRGRRARPAEAGGLRRASTPNPEAHRPAISRPSSSAWLPTSRRASR